jgi:hypothetical protein
MSPEIEKFFVELPAEKREIAMKLRDVFLSADKKITETIKWNQLTFVYKGNLAFIYSYPKSDYVNLGFMKALQLTDPKQLFEGSGKSMRHVKIYSLKDIKPAQIKAWAKEAMELNQE